jgi:hypothetical protein
MPEPDFLPVPLDVDSGEFIVTKEMLTEMKSYAFARVDQMIRAWIAAHPEIEVWQEELPGGDFRITWNRRTSPMHIATSRRTDEHHHQPA